MIAVVPHCLSSSSLLLASSTHSTCRLLHAWLLLRKQPCRAETQTMLFHMRSGISAKIIKTPIVSDTYVTLGSPWTPTNHSRLPLRAPPLLGSPMRTVRLLFQRCGSVRWRL